MSGRLKNPEPFYMQVTASMVAHLLQRDETKLNAEMTELVQQNVVLGGSLYGYLYAGQFFTPYTLSKGFNDKHPIHKSLMPAAKEHAGKLDQLNKDRRRMSTGMMVVLRPCQNWQDIRDALPDGLKRIFSDTADLPRTRPEAYTILDKPLLLDQYQMTAWLMLDYLTNHFV